MAKNVEYDSVNASIDNIEDLLPIGTVRSDYYDMLDKYLDQNPNDIKYLSLGLTNILKNGAYQINEELFQNVSSISRMLTFKFLNKVVNIVTNSRVIEVYTENLELESIISLPFYYRTLAPTFQNTRPLYYSVNTNYLFISITAGLLWTEDLENWHFIKGNFGSVIITSFDLLLIYNLETLKWQWSEDFENFTDCVGLDSYNYGTTAAMSAPIETNNNYIFMGQNGLNNNVIFLSFDGKTYFNHVAPGTQNYNNHNRVTFYNDLVVIGFNDRMYTKTLSDFIADSGSWTQVTNASTTGNSNLFVANNILFTNNKFTTNLSTFTTLTNNTAIAFNNNALTKVIYKNSKYYIYQNNNNGNGGVWVSSTLAANSFTLLATIRGDLLNINLNSNIECYEIGDNIIVNSTVGIYKIDTTDDSVELLIGTQFSSEIKELKLKGSSTFSVKVR